MVPAPPKLRTDLTVSRQQTAEGSSCIVKDPIAGRFFRFRETEEFITAQLDGETPLDVVRRRTEERFAASMAPEHLDAFVARLEKAGLLDSGGPPAKARTDARQRLRGSLLYLRFPLVDPDQHFSRLVCRIGFFFTPRFVALSAALILLAFWTTIANWSELTQDLARLYRLSAIPLALAIFFVVASAHEVAHSLMCKRFGGEVHEMGFMLIYFQPALYTNVSDAWLFPERRQRLWVGLAGPWFELFIWALAALAWRLTDVETGIHTVSLMVMAVSGIKTLVNFNPLIKLDGYYLLSDWLAVPNLRQRSFDYVGRCFSRLGGPPQETATVSRRERTIYLTYGSLAILYSLGTLWFVAIRLGGLVPRFQAWGLLMFLALFSVRLRNRLRRLPFWRSSAARPDPEAVKAAPKRNGRMVLAILAAALVGSLLVKIELRVAGEFRVLPTRNAEVRTEVEGLVAEVYVREGMKIQQGDLVARLSDRDLAAELRKTEAEIAEKQATLRMLRIGTRPEEIAVAEKEVETAEARSVGSARRYREAGTMRAEKMVRQEAAVAKAEERLKYKRSTLERMRSLYATQLISLKDLEQAEEDAVVRDKELAEARGELQITRADDLAEVRKEMALAETGLAEAKGRLAKLRAGSRREAIEAMEAEVARRETQRRFLEEQLRLTKIPSAIAGIVTTPERQLRDLIGQHVNRGDLLASVHRLDTVTAEIALSEKDVGDVSAGQRVAVKARAYPSQTFEGAVTSVAAAVRTNVATPLVKGASMMSPVPEEGGGDRVVLVTTEIENGSMLLKPEMTGRAKISCGEQSILAVLTRRLVRVVRVEFWSWW